MYAPPYGYGPGSSPPPPQPLPFDPNHGAPPPQHQQQLHVQHLQHQEPGQQHMMYSPAQYGSGPQASPYGSARPGMSQGSMGPNASGMGTMHHNGMAQMDGGMALVPTYQTPYSSSPYGAASIPISSPSNLPPNFLPTTPNAPSFPMNAPNMNPQQHPGHRMQPPPPSQNARASPFGGAPQHSPPNINAAQSHLATPQNVGQTHLHTPTNNQQLQGGTIVTPQTPNFPPGAQGGANAGSSLSSPLSPGSEVREKERVTLLLDINRELLMEVMRLQTLQAELKKDDAKDNGTARDGTGDKDKEKLEKESLEKLKAASGKEMLECMRRLQGNLGYLAAIADRSHKPSSQIPPHPAYLTAPSLAPKSSLAKPASTSPKTEAKKEDSEDQKPEEPEEDRAELFKDMYKRLQALFPGVDPNKEPQPQSGNPAARTHAQQQAAQQAALKQQQGQAQSGDQNQQQQKLLNDMAKQKMMQAQQQVQNSQHGMQGANPQQSQNR